ncbi:MAG: hypothetical protein JNK05_08405 [Myxococcales bacterium]|nr:hypothetical protein [Myxococcales bacterium]
MSSSSTSERVLRAIHRLQTAERQRALDAVVSDGRCSPAMAAWGLDAALSVFDRDAVASLARVHEGARVAVALAESVPTAPLRSIVLPLLQGAQRVRVRAPRAQRAVGSLWSALLVDEGLACQWDDEEDGDRWLERVSKTGADTVVAFGSDARIERLRAAVSGARLQGYGHGAGAAWIDSAAIDDVVEQIAWDFCAYDGVGCLSPEVLWVSGDHDAALRVAERLASAMARWATSHPRGARGREELVFERGWRASTAAASEWFSRGEWGSVALLSEDAASVVRAMGARNVILRLAGEDNTNALDWFRAHARALTSVATDDATRPVIERLGDDRSLGFCGRIVAPGDMQRPPLDGEADPRSALVS